MKSSYPPVFACPFRQQSLIRFFRTILGCAIAGVITGNVVLADDTESETGKKAAVFTVGGLKFTAPQAKNWKKVETRSSMRKAQFAVSGEAKTDPTEVVFFFFGGGQGGSVSANVDRWLGQFKEPKEKLGAETKTLEVEDRKITLVKAKGTYMSGPPFGAKTAKADFALRGAIIPAEDGPVFVKMTGPAKTVAAAEKAFLEMVKSPFPKGG